MRSPFIFAVCALAIIGCSSAKEAKPEAAPAVAKQATDVTPQQAQYPDAKVVKDAPELLAMKNSTSTSEVSESRDPLPKVIDFYVKKYGKPNTNIQNSDAATLTWNQGKSLLVVNANADKQGTHIMVTTVKK